MNQKTGKVYLIGAGPGDPGLLTIKAEECIKRADVVVYDYLASSSLLHYAGKNAEIIYVGKKGSDHTLAQDKINSLLTNRAAKGLTIARLKGGDPFIFGRGGEEAEVLIDHNIPFEVIPGVTSAIAAPAYAGIPLTHRKHASSVCLITGHEDHLKHETSIKWKAMAESNSTLVFLMGVKNLPQIREKLLENGKTSDTPVALVRWGTTSKQETIVGTLDDIVQKVETAGIKPPAVIVVGSVVSLRNKMKWFETSPLFGKRIIVTRARAQASGLVACLSDAGAECIEIPTIKIVRPYDNSYLINAVEKINVFDWLVFTSVNGVKFFFETLFAAKKDVRTLGHLKFACIGPATGKQLKQFGIICDIMPETYRAESIVQAFYNISLKDKKVLLPRAKKARPVLPDELRKLGADVSEVIAYETEIDDGNKKQLSALLGGKKIDMVTFTSSSTVSNFKKLLPMDKFDAIISNACIACIGPITAETALSHGIEPDITATEYTIPGLVNAIIDYFKGAQL